MKGRIGVICVILGVVLLLGSASLYFYNEWENAEAGESAQKAMSQVTAEICQRQQAREEAISGEDTGSMAEQETDQQDPNVATEPTAPLTEYHEMPRVEINGYDYIGYLSIPALELELPVMAEWDYDRLRIAPCRYTGTTMGNDLVILAHNYRKHFGTLNKLVPGDRVSFVDMDGIQTDYEVVLVDTVAANDVEKVAAGGADLTLFTCTYGGKQRVAVYCDRADGT